MDSLFGNIQKEIVYVFNKNMSKAFQLDAGIYKFSLVYDIDAEYTISLHICPIARSGGNEGVNGNSSSLAGGKVWDSIVVKLEQPRTFQVNEIEGHDFTEAGDYDVHTVTKELYFNDPKLGWIQVGEWYWTYPAGSIQYDVMPDHDEYNEEKYTANFMENGEFTEYKADANATFGKPILGKALEPVPLDLIISMAHLNKALKDNRVELRDLCTCFGHRHAMKLFNRSKNHELRDHLRYMDGMSRDEILKNYTTFKTDIEKSTVALAQPAAKGGKAGKRRQKSKKDVPKQKI